MFSSEQRFDQGIFTSKWNTVVKKLKQLNYQTKLPILSKSGSCSGLCYCLLDYLQEGREDEFYHFYSLICESNSENLAFWLAANSYTYNNFINKLYEFIYKVSILQEKQLENAFPVDAPERQSPTERELAKLESNYPRINVTQEDRDCVKLRYFSDLASSVNYLANDTDKAVMLDFYQTKAKNAHSILVYKNNGKICVFDPNVGKQKNFDNVEAAISEIVYNINLLFTPTNEINYLLSMPKGYAKLHFYCENLLLVAEHFAIPPTQPTSKINQTANNTTSDSKNQITRQTIQKVIEEYISDKKNTYLGLPWLTCKTSIKQFSKILFFVEDDTKRAELVKKFIQKNHNDFSSHLTKHFPDLTK